jgi:hypothetical protein
MEKVAGGVKVGLGQRESRSRSEMEKVAIGGRKDRGRRWRKSQPGLSRSRPAVEKVAAEVKVGCSRWERILQSKSKYFATDGREGRPKVEKVAMGCEEGRGGLWRRSRTAVEKMAVDFKICCSRRCTWTVGGREGRGRWWRRSGSARK